MTVFSTPSDMHFLCPHNGDSFPRNFEFVTIHDLCTDTPVENRYRKVLLLVTLYIKTAASSAEPVSWYSKRDRGQVKYERILYAWDVNAPAGRNIVAIILGKSTNINFFQDVLKIRDNGALGNLLLCVIVFPRGQFHVPHLSRLCFP